MALLGNVFEFRFSSIARLWTFGLYSKQLESFCLANEWKVDSIRLTTETLAALFEISKINALTIFMPN